MGPGAGEKGGRVIAEGTPEDIAAAPHSLTGQYLKGLVGEKAASPKLTKGKRSNPRMIVPSPLAGEG